MAEIERLLEAASGLPLRLAAGLGVASVTVVVRVRRLRALLLLGLGLRLGLGRPATPGHAGARQSVLLGLELGSQAGVGIFARAVTLPLLGWRKRDLNLPVGTRVICVVGRRAAVSSVIG